MEFDRNEVVAGRGNSRRRTIIISLAILGGVIAAVSLAAGFLGIREPGLSRAAPAEPQAASPVPPAPPRVSEVLSRMGVPAPTPDGKGKLAQKVGDLTFTYTLDPELQKLIEGIYAQFKVPYGAFVAIEPSTGRVLAMAEYSSMEPGTKGLCLKATYPAASLIKVITSAAALKTGKVTPETVVGYEGSPYRLSQRKVSPNNARNERQKDTLTQALGRSNNVVFAKMGINVVGAPGLEAELSDFGFNRQIPFDFALQKSTAIVPSETYPLAQTSAGFGDVYLSPLHAALIAASVANGGVMMKPYIVDKVEDSTGNALYSAASTSLGKVIDPGLARTLSAMMTATVYQGTSKKIFTRYARNLMNRITVAGKTGSLTGEDPPGRYEWFIGFAPLENPKIAVASLVVNRGEMWHIKGTYAAAAAMRQHFGM